MLILFVKYLYAVKSQYLFPVICYRYVNNIRAAIGFSPSKRNNFLGYERVSTVFVNALYSYAYLVAFQVNDLRTRYS